MGLRPKWLQFDLSKTEDKLKLFILVSGLLIFIGVATVTAIQLTMYPEFCQTCHIMKPEYRTWQATSHSNIRCTECHIEPGVFNLIKHKIGAMKELYLYATNTYPTPIKMSHKIENFVCEKCHSITTRKFTVSGDIKIPHTRHIESKITEVYCVDCHAGVAHGKISERGMITEGSPTAVKKGDLAAWTLDDGKQQTIREFTKADMDDCIACHVKNKQSIKCETCHATIKTPDNHTPVAAWLPQHGKDAEKDINVCKSCHNYGMTVKQVVHTNKAIAYAWGNEYCVNCHSQAPASHKEATWRKMHKTQVAAKGINNCFACHSQTSKEGPQAPARITCDRCH